MTASTEDITVILTCPKRGRFLHPAVKSIGAAIARAESELAVSIGWIAAADRSSRESAEYLESYLPSRARKLLIENGDPAALTNRAVAEAKGKLIALVSGDDLVSSNWLSESFRACSNQSQTVIFHPGTVIVYGKSCFLFVTPDQEHPDFSRDMLWSRSPWPGISFGNREIFSAHRFVESDAVRGFGHSDWHWICETVANGILHKPVPGTLSCCHQTEDHACILNVVQALAPSTAPAPQTVPGEKQHLLIPPSRLFQVSRSGRSLR